MKLHLGGHLSFYAPQKQANLELEIVGRKPLTGLLLELHLPQAEVMLVVINGEMVELSEAYVSNQDLVELFPPIGGGCIEIRRQE